MKTGNFCKTRQRIFISWESSSDRRLIETLGKRYAEYRNKWAKVSLRKMVSGFPLYLQFEFSGRCNLRCPVCVQGIKALRGKYATGFKPLEMKLYKKVLKEASGYHCPSIAFHNNDEPLLLKDLEERIALAKKAGFIDLIMTTNATLLNPKRSRGLIRSGLTKINFSVDSGNAKEYGRIRKGGDFQKVLRNIEDFVSIRSKMGMNLPITRATCVLSSFTCKSMEDFRKFWKKKVECVEFQHFQALKGFTENLRPANSKRYANFTCNSPWQQLVIRANGDVLPCCSFYGTQLVLGNIKRDNLADIWNGGKMKGLRNRLKKGDFSTPACRSCSQTFYYTHSKGTLNV